MESRKYDNPLEIHYQAERFWLDSSGWYYSLRGNKINGPFASEEQAKSHFKQLMPEQTSEPLVYMAIGSKGLVFHGDLHSLDEDSMLLSCDEPISQDCVEQSCMVCVTSLLAGDIIEFEIKCHIDKIIDQGVELLVQKSDTNNMQKLLKLIDHMKHLF